MQFQRETARDGVNQVENVEKSSGAATGGVADGDGVDVPTVAGSALTGGRTLNVQVVKAPSAAGVAGFVAINPKIDGAGEAGIGQRRCVHRR